jgi:hypothetical protein
MFVSVDVVAVGGELSHVKRIDASVFLNVVMSQRNINFIAKLYDVLELFVKKLHSFYRRSKNARSYTSTPQYAFMAWCLIKKKAQGHLDLLPLRF